jgi:hypothetical protein
MERKSSMSIEMASMADNNILGFITYNHTRSRKLRQSVRARVIEMAVAD